MLWVNTTTWCWIQITYIALNNFSRIRLLDENFYILTFNSLQHPLNIFMYAYLCPSHIWRSLHFCIRSIYWIHFQHFGFHRNVFGSPKKSIYSCSFHFVNHLYFEINIIISNQIIFIYMKDLLSIVFNKKSFIYCKRFGLKLGSKYSMSILS